MPVPDYETLMLPVLKLFAGGARNVSECVPTIKAQFNVSDEEAQELIPSGSATLLQSRTHWARTYLSKAGLLASPKRNFHVITDAGKALLRTNPERIDNAVLDQFVGFRDWIINSRSKGDHDQARSPPADSARKRSPANTDPPPSVLTEAKQTPEDALESASALLESTLREELLARLLEMSPPRFERLILDLLNAMGYGGGLINSASMTKATGDGGIDGIINEDALGLDAVYIQAKLYAPENSIGRPHLQQFVGSLTGESATKGVFVTTSDFSREAREFVKRVQQRIVLINGSKLTELLVQHNIGVRPRISYTVKSVDEDYFHPEESADAYTSKYSIQGLTEFWEKTLGFLQFDWCAVSLLPDGTALTSFMSMYGDVYWRQEFPNIQAARSFVESSGFSLFVPTSERLETRGPHQLTNFRLVEPDHARVLLQV